MSIRVIVATDSHLIVDAVISRGLEAMLTSETHLSGTDRIAEVAESSDQRLRSLLIFRAMNLDFSRNDRPSDLEQMHQSWPVLMAPGLLQHGNLSRSLMT
jgi:hypothetical protein